MQKKESADLYLEKERLRTENAALRKKLHDLEESVVALEASNKTLGMVVEGTQAGYWDWNIKSGELDVNAEWASLVGYSLDELQPLTINTWRTLCHPEDLPLSNQLIKDCFTGGTTLYEHELRMLHKLGHWVWVLDKTTLHHDRPDPDIGKDVADLLVSSLEVLFPEENGGDLHIHDGKRVDIV